MEPVGSSFWNLLFPEWSPTMRKVDMPPIQTVEDAVSAAEHFLGRYYSFKTLKAVRKDNSDWYLEFDVGILSSEIVKMTIEGSTGTVIAYQVEPKD